MTWLVTGGSGFLGRHVLDVLADRGDRVIALGRRHPGGWPVHDFVRQDLEDIPGLRRSVASIAPDRVIHAAGRTPPSTASALYRANTRLTAIILDVLRDLDRPTRVVLAGSAAELGPVASECLPVDESHPCRPSDAYGLSKWAASTLGMRAGGRLEVLIGRVFNPIGPSTPEAQVLGRFASLLASSGSDPLAIATGDLSARRDFVDVRDVAEAFVALAERGCPGEVYHIGTGESRSVGEGLEGLIRLSGRSVGVQECSGSRGPSDSRADIRKIVERTGWTPRRSWETSLSDLWDDARRRAVPRRAA